MFICRQWLYANYHAIISYELNEKIYLLAMKCKKLLGLKQEILYVNEQSFSKSLIPLFKNTDTKKLFLNM